MLFKTTILKVDLSHGCSYGIGNVINNIVIAKYDVG